MFLRSRREQLTPDAVGLAHGSRRRTIGLRRGEVAELAGISVDWYTRLEQGKVGSPSMHTLDALARVLRLAPAEHAHLRMLVQPSVISSTLAVQVPDAVTHLIEQWQHPAYLVNDRWDLLAWNDAAATVFGNLGCGNLLSYMLLDESAKMAFGDDWNYEAQRMIGKFRKMYDQHADQAEFDSLIDELQNTSPCFATWWLRHDIVSQGTGRKLLRDQLGNFHSFEYLSMNVTDAPHLRLSLYMPTEL